MKNGLLVDNEVLELFKDEEDFESVKIIIEKIKNKTHQNMITKNVFYKNPDELSQVFSEIPEEKQRIVENLKIKLGLSIEISREVISNVDYKKDEKNNFISLGNVKVLTANKC